MRALGETGGRQRRLEGLWTGLEGEGGRGRERRARACARAPKVVARAGVAPDSECAAAIASRACGVRWWMARHPQHHKGLLQPHYP